ncbi:hypothetical protein ACFC09_29760 [Streptomyces sp. NPDC056161]|uniref:hypothetical protein n=1 Tax=Streptomyces sp. NPDC056161 TaxID=3345732 RepID=UPI0035D5B054
MAVTDSAWWGVWWVWMVAWLVAAAGVLSLCVLLLRLAHSRFSRPRRVHPGLKICVYLHEQSVKNLDELGNYTATLEKVVEETHNVTTSSGLWTRLTPFGMKADRGTSRETFTSFVQRHTPLSTVGVLLSVLDREDAVVHVDLRSGSLALNRALRRELAAAGGRMPEADRLALSDIREFVSVQGHFTARPGADGGYVLRARYGDGAEPSYLRVPLSAAGLQIDSMYEGEFQALGKTAAWNPGQREVTLDAIAIFR